MIQHNQLAKYTALLKAALEMGVSMTEVMIQLRKDLDDMEEGPSKQQMLALSVFIMKVESNIRLLSQTSYAFMPLTLIQAVPLVPEGNLYRIEFFHIANRLAIEAGFTTMFDPADCKETAIYTILRTPKTPDQTFICDGCGILPGLTHTCHHHNVTIHGNVTTHSCECQQCVETETYMMLGMFADETIIQMQEYLKSLPPFHHVNT